MAITQVGSMTISTDTAATFANPTTITKPTGAAQGDLVVIYFAHNGQGGTPTMADGFTRLHLSTNDSMQTAVFYKVLGASESGSWNISHLSDYRGAVAVALRGVDQAAPIDASALTDVYTMDAGASHPTYAGVTSTFPGVMLVLGAMDRDGAHISAAPSGYTLLGETNQEVEQKTLAAAMSEFRTPGAIAGGAFTRDYATLDVASSTSLFVKEANAAPTAPTVTAPNGGEEWDASHTITWTAGTDPNGSTLTYDIDLSVDNGGVWTSLYTGVSGTSKVHDFSAAADTSTALIRIRSVDPGGLSSGWDQSNGVFSIVHNTAPNAPTSLNPASGKTIDKDATQRFSWTFSDPDTQDTQSAYDLRYRVVGTATWTVVSGSGTPYRDFPAGTFAAGDWEWQVRTTDNGGLTGPYSASASFTAAAAPAGPSITSPINGGTVNTDTYTVEWTSAAQDAFQVRTVADSAGTPDTATVYQDTGTVTSTSIRARSMTFDTTGRDEHVQVRVQTSGLWSSWVSVQVSVSYTAPPTPTIVVTADDTNEHITVAMTNPAPTGSQPVVSSNEVFVRVVAGGRADVDRTVAGDGVRIATGVANGGSYVDRAVASGVDYEYRAKAVGANGVGTYSTWS